MKFVEFIFLQRNTHMHAHSYNFKVFHNLFTPDLPVAKFVCRERLAKLVAFTFYNFASFTNNCTKNLGPNYPFYNVSVTYFAACTRWDTGRCY